MKLVTFQSIEALEYLNKHGYLICDEKYINKEKSDVIYNWVNTKMNEQIPNKDNIKYPIWAWVKCYNSIAPKKHIGKRVEGFDVKITFNKKEEDIFITDYRRFSFLLNNLYIPKDLEDKLLFDRLLKENNITEQDLVKVVRKDKYKEHRQDKEFLEICDKIQSSFDRCITKESNVLQGCVYCILKDEIESIEILDKNDGYIYGSLNYIHKNGKRHDWINEFYNTLR